MRESGSRCRSFERRYAHVAAGATCFLIACSDGAHSTYEDTDNAHAGGAEAGPPDSGPVVRDASVCLSGRFDCMHVCDGPAVVDRCGDCNGANARMHLFYRDADRDGFGDPAAPLAFCADAPPEGYADAGSDCNDALFACAGDCKNCRAKLRFRPGTKLISGSPNLGELDLSRPALAGLGDVNSDGVGDIIVGRRIIFLSAKGDALGSHQLSDADFGDAGVGATLGSAVTGLGDIDRDGVPDLAIAEPGYADDAGTRGRAWVVRLKPDGTSAAVKAHRFTPSVVGCYTQSIYYAGAAEEMYGAGAPVFASDLTAVDMDHDGVNELAVSSSKDCMQRPEDKSAHTDSGRIDVLFLKSDGSASRAIRYDGTQAPYSPTQFLGARMAEVRLAGASAGSTALAASVEGGVWLLNVLSDGKLEPLKRLSGLGTDADIAPWARSFLSSPGDVDHDGKTELLATLIGAAHGGLSAFQIESNGTYSRLPALTGPDDGLGVRIDDASMFGTAIAPLGDLDGDGLPELAALSSAKGDGGTAALYVLHHEALCDDALRGDCNGSLTDGCETTLTVPEHCGACGYSCMGRPNSDGGACSPSGHCVLNCRPGFADCNQRAEDGCEESATAANVVGIDCQQGKVTLRCQAHYGDCDLDLSNGCETDLDTAADNCGSCGRKCGYDPVRHVDEAQTCVAGACGRSKWCTEATCCSGAWTDLNKDPSDGCEACGSENQVEKGLPAPRLCTKDEVCVARTNNGMQSDPGIVTTLGNVCETHCAVGTGDCDGDASNGCEADLTLEARCGACNNQCGIWGVRYYCVLNEDGTNYACRY